SDFSVFRPSWSVIDSSFLGPTGATAKGSHLARANYASGALSRSPFRLAQRFCRPAVTNGTRHRLILDQQNDMVRRIPYSRLTISVLNRRTFHRQKNSPRSRCQSKTFHGSLRRSKKNSTRRSGGWKASTRRRKFPVRKWAGR